MATPNHRARPRAVAWYEAAVFLSALAVLVGLTADLLSRGFPTVTVPVAVAAVAAPFLARFQISVEHRSQGVTVTFESAALIFMLLVGDPLQALWLWSLFVPFGLFRGRSRWRVHLFNISLAVLSGLVLTLVLGALGDSDPRRVGTLVVTVLACTASTGVDLLLSWFHVQLRTGTPIRALISWGDVLIGTGVLYGTASMAYLGALLHQLQTSWVMLVLAVPIGAVFVASAASRSSLDDRRRLSVLLAASRSRRDLGGTEKILEAAAGHARQLLGSEEVDVRAEAPTPPDLGARVDLPGGQARWLVSRPRRDRDTWTDSERQGLATLAADTSESLERSALFAELSRMARMDSLTGLANRRTFTEELTKALERAPHEGRWPALLYLDLDNFKLVNDWYGHHVGDALVREVSQRITGVVGPEVVTARLGGDEFAVLINDQRSPEVVEQVADDLAARLGQQLVIEDRELSVGASIGVAFATEGLSSDDLFRNADLAMYHAKTRSGSSVSVYQESLRERVDRRSQLQGELAKAAELGQLRIVYQPVYDLQRGHLHGVEALVRWQHPTRGLLSAEDFIDVAEESGHIRTVGAWVLRRAMNDAPRMTTAAGRPLTVAVNVSPRQLVDDAFVALVRDVVGRAAAGAHLVLELTESAVLTEDPDVKERLQRLVAAGADLALDDFGVGYSSVGYLRWLPMRILKLDRSLVTSIADEPRARHLFEALLVMGRALDLIVIAEGIENAGQADNVRDLGCQLAQGWHYARPMPIDQLLRLLVAERRVCEATEASVGAEADLR